MGIAVDTYSSIRKMIDIKIREALASIPKSTIARVVVATKNTVSCKRVELTGTIDAILTEIPIIRPYYNHYPVKTGDLGVLIPCSVGLDKFVKTAMIPTKKLEDNTNGSGYMFFPLCSKDLDFASDPMANEMYSLDGQSKIILDIKQILLNDKFQNKVSLEATGITIQDLSQNSIKMSASGLTIKDSSQNTIECSASGITIKDSKGNTIEMGTGIKIKDMYNNSIETTAVSVTIKNASCTVELGAAGVSINNGALEILP